MDADPEPLRMYPSLGAEHASWVVLPAVRQVSAVSTSHPCWLVQVVHADPPASGEMASPNDPARQEHVCVPGPVWTQTWSSAVPAQSSSSAVHGSCKLQHASRSLGKLRTLHEGPEQSAADAEAFRT